MAFIENSSICRIAEIINNVVSLLERSDDKATLSWCNSVFAHACRQLECFISPEVSVLADEKARLLGLGDLATQKWGFQAYEEIEGERVKIFHWEHVLPVAEIRRRVIGLGVDRTAERVAAVLQDAEIAWILKTENSKLDSNGYRHTRDGDPWNAYKTLGIRIRGKEW